MTRFAFGGGDSQFTAPISPALLLIHETSWSTSSGGQRKRREMPLFRQPQMTHSSCEVHCW